MAKFYGSVRGQRGEAHRLGHSSMTTIAASWSGGVQVTMHQPADADEPWVRIETIAWRGNGRSNLVYDGPLSSMQSASPAEPAYARRAA